MIASSLFFGAFAMLLVIVGVTLAFAIHKSQKERKTKDRTYTKAVDETFAALALHLKHIDEFVHLVAGVGTVGTPHILTNEEIKKMFSEIFEGAMTAPTITPVAPTEKPAPTVETFINNLEYVRKEYATTNWERGVLRSIINRIKIKHANRTPAAR